MAYVAGIDFGTSGARITVMDIAETVVAHHQADYPLDMAADWSYRWRAALGNLLESVAADMRIQLQAIAINGTSATVLLCDEAGEPVTPPLLYDDDCGQAHRDAIAAVAPPGNPAISATSSLVKLLWWRQTLPTETFGRARYLLHQADWLAFLLHGQPGLSDYHNALKLGYDVGALRYPDWLLALGLTPLLPVVQAPGTAFGKVTQAAGDRYGLSQSCTVVAGTTDSIAAFLASGAHLPGEAVTSLGSTLVLKLLSKQRVDDSRYGIYSHRLGDLWLVGGASNTGGSVLRHFFTDAALRSLSAKIKPDQPSGLDYYPLRQAGERFPVSDPTFQPRLEPRPASPEAFLHGLLEGIARIEAQGYERLQELGASPLMRVLSAGGGAQNSTWTAIRQHHLPVPVMQAPATEASLGTARLALQALRKKTRVE